MVLGGDVPLVALLLATKRVPIQRVILQPSDGPKPSPHNRDETNRRPAKSQAQFSLSYRIPAPSFGISAFCPASAASDYSQGSFTIVNYSLPAASRASIRRAALRLGTCSIPLSAEFVDRSGEAL